MNAGLWIMVVMFFGIIAVVAGAAIVRQEKAVRKYERDKAARQPDGPPDA